MSSKRKQWISGIILAIVVPLVMLWLFEGCRSADYIWTTKAAAPPVAGAARVHSVDQLLFPLYSIVWASVDFASG